MFPPKVHLIASLSENRMKSYILHESQGDQVFVFSGVLWYGARYLAKIIKYTRKVFT
jgi:hypothetical protein